MVKNHIKALTVPKTWPVKRKSRVWMTKPQSGAHSLDFSLALNLAFKDVLNLAETTKEAKYILSSQEVLVDQKRRYDRKFGIGFMDTLSLPLLGKHYRLSFDNQGRLKFMEIPENEAKLKLSKILNKTYARGKSRKLQLNLSDGRNILCDKDTYKTGDSLMLEMPSQKIMKHLPLKKGAYIYLVGGKHMGLHGRVEDIQEGQIVFKAHDAVMKTLKRYAFVVGEEKSEVTIC